MTQQKTALSSIIHREFNCSWQKSDQVVDLICEKLNVTEKVIPEIKEFISPLEAFKSVLKDSPDSVRQAIKEVDELPNPSPKEIDQPSYSEEEVIELMEWLHEEDWAQSDIDGEWWRWADAEGKRVIETNSNKELLTQFKNRKK